MTQRQEVSKCFWENDTNKFKVTAGLPQNLQFVKRARARTHTQYLPSSLEQTAVKLGMPVDTCSQSAVVNQKSYGSYQ